MSDKVTFHGWRKPPGGIWEKIEGTASESQLECMHLLTQLCMLRVGEEMDTEYFVLPEGQTPQGQRDRQSYLHRSMRPWWGQQS